MLGGEPSSPGESRTPASLENSANVSAVKQPEASTSLPAAESELRLENFDALAKAISSMLGSLIEDFDCKAENTAKSQDHLTFALDRLTRELDKLLEDAPLPFIMQHAAKISGVHKRVSSLNLLLRSIQRRIDNIDRMIAAGSSHEKLKPDTPVQNQH